MRKEASRFASRGFFLLPFPTLPRQMDYAPRLQMRCVIHLPNPVGYQNCDAAGEAMITPTFLPVGGGDFKISDIKVEGAIGQGEVSMQDMGSDGRFLDTTYYYLDAGMMPWIAGTGWYHDITGFDPVDEEDFLEPGEGICFTATDVDLTITFKKVLD